MLKVRQQKAALRVAFDVFRQNGFDRPKKKHVLNFIRLKDRFQFPPDELVTRDDEDIDAIWANDIAWKRKDLFEDGEVDSSETWQMETHPSWRRRDREEESRMA